MLLLLLVPFIHSVAAAIQIQGVDPKIYYATPNTPLVIPCSPILTHLAESTHRLISQCNEREFCLPSTSPNAFQNNQTAVAELGPQPWRNAKKVPNDGTCVPRLCRRDLHPFGYPDPPEEDQINNRKAPRRSSKSSNNSPISGIVNHALDRPPPLCPSGTFCPDDGSGCSALRTIGEKCELNRHDECLSTSEVPAVCLRGVCV